MVTTKPAPTSPFANANMRLRMTIPMDWRRPDNGDSYELYWDDNHDYGMLHPRPSVEEVAKYYEISNYYTHSGADIRRKPGSFSGIMSRLLGRLTWERDQSVYLDESWFSRYFGDRKVRILDVGCGGGVLLAELQSAGHEVIGLEPDPAARKVASDRGLVVYDGSAENYPAAIEPNSFDVVLMIHVLEHTVDPVAAVKSVSDVLKPGGVYIVETPNHQAVSFHHAGPTWRWLDVPRHLNFFTPKSLDAMCSLAGLQSQRTEFRGYTRQFEREWISEEQKIWDHYETRLNGGAHILPKRNTQWGAWKLFSQTAFAADAQKYDSLRVIAEKPFETA